MKTDQRTARAVLVASFRRNGYVRRPNLERLAAEGYQQYKKGYEVRLVASSLRELRDLRRALLQTGFTPERPFRKAQQYRLPIYGRQAVARFLKLVGKRRA